MIRIKYPLLTHKQKATSYHKEKNTMKNPILRIGLMLVSALLWSVIAVCPALAADSANFSIIVVAEGTLLEGKTIEVPGTNMSGISEHRLGGVARVLCEIIQSKTDLETRVSSLGYIQRGGVPVAYDRSLATAFGVRATEIFETKTYGLMTAVRGNRITTVPLAEMEDKVKTMNLSVYRVAEVFFG